MFFDNHLGFDDDGKGWIKVLPTRRQRQVKRKTVSSEEAQQEKPEREAAEGQDWSRVVIKSKKSDVRRENHREGAHQLKEARGTAESMAPAQMRRLEQSQQPPKRKELSSDSRRKMQQLRFGMGFTQDQLNAMCSFPVNTIREIEAGHLCPNPRQLAAISHELKSTLKYEWI